MGMRSFNSHITLASPNTMGGQLSSGMDSKPQVTRMAIPDNYRITIGDRVVGSVWADFKTGFWVARTRAHSNIAFVTRKFIFSADAVRWLSDIVNNAPKPPRTKAVA